MPHGIPRAVHVLDASLPGADGWDIITAEELGKYQDANAAGIKAAIAQIHYLVTGYRDRYHGGCPETDAIRQANAQRLQVEWEDKNLPWEGPWLDPFTIVMPCTLNQLNFDLQHELLYLMRKLRATDTSQPLDPTSASLDVYNDPISQRLSELTVPKSIPLSQPLPLYTEKGKEETYAALLKLRKFVSYFRRDAQVMLDPNFYLWRRTLNLRPTSVMVTLFRFMETQYRGRDSFIERGWYDWDDLISSGYQDTLMTSTMMNHFLEQLYCVANEGVFTDKTWTTDEDYDPILPTRYDFKPQCREMFEKGLEILATGVFDISLAFTLLIKETFRGGLPKEHPDVIVAWEAAKEINNFLRFYSEGLFKYLKLVKALPPLVTNWVEPTRKQTHWLKEQDIEPEWFAKPENIDFFKFFKVPSVDLENSRYEETLDLEGNVPGGAIDVENGARSAIDIENEGNGEAQQPDFAGWNPTNGDLLDPLDNNQDASA
ncbi:hypothetical protein TWF481_000582 [Arthrobotrys musiformis]|uniref:Uncharacterized protein n=1 Tax=Arthrobotrys musiformis TaxID=47236 RepID=A0AAV9WP46_9PEZI